MVGRSFHIGHSLIEPGELGWAGPFAPGYDIERVARYSSSSLDRHLRDRRYTLPYHPLEGMLVQQMETMPKPAATAALCRSIAPAVIVVGLVGVAIPSQSFKRAEKCAAPNET
jgi:hypothetical protein